MAQHSMNLYLKGAEMKWMQMLNGIGEPAGWQAVHFHLDRLLEQYQSEYQIKIAVNMINDLLKHYDGGIFLLTGNSIAVMCNGLEKSVHTKLIFQLRYLYMDDPLAYTADGQENPDFCTSYDLKTDFQACMDLCMRYLSGRRTGALVKEPRKPVIESPVPAIALGAQTLLKGTHFSAQLAAIEQGLRRADLSQVIRRQPVCAAQPNMPVKRVFDELYIHIAHLRRILGAEVDMLSNRWLFKYLTHALDERMIELIRNTPAYLQAPVSINLNVETLLSARFAEFNAATRPEVRVSIIIELPVMDVFADMTAFTLARKEAQKLGYRVCLDGLTTDSFSQINREKLGVDLLKMQWNADVESDLNTSDNIQLIQALRASGNNRVILCRCDNRQAIEYGQALGISLFQGRAIDALLDPTAKIEN